MPIYAPHGAFKKPMSCHIVDNHTDRGLVIISLKSREAELELEINTIGLPFT